MKFRMGLLTKGIIVVSCARQRRPEYRDFIYRCLVKMVKTLCCCLMDVYYDLIFNEFIFALTLLSALFFTFMWACVCVNREVAEGSKIDKGSRSEMGVNVWMCSTYDLWWLYFTPATCKMFVCICHCDKYKVNTVSSLATLANGKRVGKVIEKPLWCVIYVFHLFGVFIVHVPRRSWWFIRKRICHDVFLVDCI